MIRSFISRVVKGDDLTQDEMEKAMTTVMEGGATPAQIGALITGLRMKGELSLIHISEPTRPY